jgi:hypothetical protein
MPEQISLIDVAAEPLPEFVPPRTEIFLVLAFHRQMGIWKVHRESNRDEHASQAEAVTAAGKLAAGWTHRRVLRVVAE